jgi:hypothetical protein
METNSTPIVPALRAGRLYSPQQIAVAALLGTPMAASWLFAGNFAVLGEHRARQRALVWGIVGTVVIIAIAFVLPARFPAPVLPMAYTMGLRELAKQQQGAAFQNHLAAGGERQSNWRVVGIGLGAFTIIASLGFAAAYLLPSE